MHMMVHLAMNPLVLDGGCVDRLLEQPTALNFMPILQTCKETQDLAFAKHVHMRMRDHGLESHKVIGNCLVQMYAVCDSMHNAQHLFDRLIERNEHSWTSLIEGYVKEGHLKHALKIFFEMEHHNVPCNMHTFLAAMKACARLQDLRSALAVHMEIVKEELEDDRTLGNTLVDMYAKCKCIKEAEEVFTSMSCRDAVSWNALIAGYVEHGCNIEAVDCLVEMTTEGIYPNAVTFLCSLKACSNLKAGERGQKIHDEVIREGFEMHSFLASSLVDMYAKCGLLVEAQELFAELPVQSVVPWTALISGYVEHGLAEEALACLQSMQSVDVIPHAVTYICCLKACTLRGASKKGQELHSEVVKDGFETDPFLRSTLVDMYASCGMLVDAQEVFNELPVRCLVSWTALISGYADHGFDEEALSCLKRMQSEGIQPNAVTYVCSLKACANVRALCRGQMIHLEIVSYGLEKNSYVLNALIGMYAKCGQLDEAWELFCDASEKEVIAWNAIILGYAEQGDPEISFAICAQMLEQVVLSHDMIFMSLLKACGSLGGFEMGKRVHMQVCQTIDRDMATALLDMYGKCGSMMDGQAVFDATPQKDVIMWTSLITGYTQQGKCELVFNLLEKMREEGLMPNDITFLGILTACCHGGLVTKGLDYFEAMIECGIMPTAKHQNCMVDILLRAGRFNEALMVVERGPFCVGTVTWITVLCACRDKFNADLASLAFAYAVHVDMEHPALYILMANLFAGWESMVE